MVSPSARALPNFCNELTPQTVSQSSQPKNFLDLIDEDNAKTARMQETARRAYALFRLQGTSLSMPLSCFASREDKDLYTALVNQVSLEESYLDLKQAKSQVIKDFVNQLAEKTQNGKYFPFVLAGHFFGQAPAAYRAGFNRSSGGIYMDVSQIPRNEWLVILSHEFIHNLDDRMTTAIEKFSDESTVSEVLRIAQGPSPTANELTFVSAWIFEGLNKGLLAEYRAWVATDLIYQAGLEEGLWNRISWIDDFVNARDPQQRQIQILQKLLELKQDPDFTKTIFQWPLLQTQYQKLIEALRARSAPLPIEGRLSRFH